MKLAKSGFFAAVVVGLICFSAMDAEARLRFRRARATSSCSTCTVSTGCGPSGCHVPAPTSCGPTGCNVTAAPAPCATCAPAAK